MSSLTSTIISLQDILGRIQSNNTQSQQYKNNAAMAGAGAAAAILLTSGSKKQSVRTIGNLAALGGVLYGNNQSNKAALLDAQNIQLISGALGIVESQGVQHVQRRSDPTNTVCQFVEVLLRLGLQVDGMLKRNAGRIKNRGILTNANQELLLNAECVDIVQNKLRLNRIITQIDRKINIKDYAAEFKQDILGIDRGLLRKQSIYTIAVIWALLISGILLGNVHQSAVAIFLAGLVLYAVNSFFPLFSEPRKLRKASNRLINGLTAQPSVLTLVAQ